MPSQTIILITGANQGLGYYTAQQLAAEGKYLVLLGSRDFSKAEKAIASLAADDSVKVDSKNLEPVQIDINDDASIQAAADTVEKKYGKLDILLNNAAIALPTEEEAYKAGGSTLRDFYRQHYETNVIGMIAAAEAFIPLLRKGEKRLAFTSSSVGSLHAAAVENLTPGVSVHQAVFVATILTVHRCSWRIALPSLPSTWSWCSTQSNWKGKASLSAPQTQATAPPTSTPSLVSKILGRALRR